MKGVNKLILLGTAGRDAEMQGKVVSFSIAINAKKKDNSNNYVETTEWYNIKCFSPLADTALKYIKKGMHLYIEGRIFNNKWTDKEGKTHYNIDLIAHDIRFLGGKVANAEEPSSEVVYQYPPPSQEAVALLDDDIPF